MHTDRLSILKVLADKHCLIILTVIANDGNVASHTLQSTSGFSKTTLFKDATTYRMWTCQKKSWDLLANFIW